MDENERLESKNNNERVLGMKGEGRGRKEKKRADKQNKRK